MTSDRLAVQTFRFLGAAAMITTIVVSSASADAPMDRFLAQLGSSGGATGEAAALIREKWAACADCDPNEFLTQSLAVLSPPFREGLDAYDADDYERCAARMAALSGDADPFVAVHAAVYEIKALVDMERFVEADQRIDRLTADGGDRLATHSYFAPEIAFTKGFCLLADLQYDAAENALTTFLTEHGDAPPRLSLAAKQILTELANRESGKIGEVADLMDYSGRRLKSSDGGEVVQTRQQRIIELLDRLIKDAEEQEKNSCNSSSSSGNQSGKSSLRSPATPMSQSQLPGGSPQDDSSRPGRRANPGDTWGAMPPAERERILQALRESFPARYRRLVEQYYEQLAKQP